MEEEIKEYNVEMIFYNEENKYSEDEILNMLIDFAESKDLLITGTVKLIK